MEQAVDLRCELRNALAPLAQREQVLTYLREAETVAEKLADNHRLGTVCHRIAAILREMQDYEPALAYCQRAHTLATALGDVALQVAVNQAMGNTYLQLGDYCQAMEYLQQALTALQGEWRSQSFGGIVLYSVQTRVLMVQCFRELGKFVDGVAYGDEALQIAEAVNRPFERLTVYSRVGSLHVRQGTLRTAIPLLERTVALSQDANISVLHRGSASYLALAYALAGRAADAFAVLGQVEGDPIIHSEAYLHAGCVEEAHRLAQRGFANAHDLKTRGQEAGALWLLGEITMRRDPADIAQAAVHYQQALALAHELGMRPLQAHCHYGLGRLYYQTGRAEEVRAALTAAIDLYRAMDMTFWLPQAEAALAEVVAVQRPRRRRQKRL